MTTPGRSRLQRPQTESDDDLERHIIYSLCSDTNESFFYVFCSIISKMTSDVYTNTCVALAWSRISLSYSAAHGLFHLLPLRDSFRALAEPPNPDVDVIVVTDGRTAFLGMSTSAPPGHGPPIPPSRQTIA